MSKVRENMSIYEFWWLKMHFYAILDIKIAQGAFSVHSNFSKKRRKNKILSKYQLNLKAEVVLDFLRDTASLSIGPNGSLRRLSRPAINLGCCHCRCNPNPISALEKDHCLQNKQHVYNHRTNLVGFLRWNLFHRCNFSWILIFHQNYSKVSPKLWRSFIKILFQIYSKSVIFFQQIHF